MNSFGRIFRVSVFGESHSKIIGITIDGCPAGIEFSELDLLSDLERRKSKAKGTTSRKESDEPQIISGVYNGFTTGAPVTIIFENSNIKPSDYAEFKSVFRPGHADFTASMKFNSFNDLSGGGHFSGRLSLGLVAAGVLAKKILKNIDISAKIIEIGGSKDFDSIISEVVEKKDSVGGIIECIVKNLPVGLGEPFFDSVESLVSHAVFSIPGIKGIEFGSGFQSAKMFGNEHNDVFISTDGKTLTNNSGGINGGITNGNDLIFRVAIKPTSSIGKIQKTMNFSIGEMVDLQIKGRHDACFALRLPVIIEAVTAIVLVDLLLIHKMNK